MRYIFKSNSQFIHQTGLFGVVLAGLLLVCCFFFIWKFRRFLSMLDLKFRDPISLVFHEPCVMLTFKVPCLFYLEGVSEKNACSFERLTGRMGHQLCPAAAHKPLLSAPLCTASNKIKERGRN